MGEVGAMTMWQCETFFPRGVSQVALDEAARKTVWSNVEVLLCGVRLDLTNCTWNGHEVKP